MRAGDGTRYNGVLGWAPGSAIDLVVDPVCQVVLVLHLWGEASEDLTQEPPNCVCDVADTREAYATDQPVGVNGCGVYRPAVDFQVQYAGRGFVLMDLCPDHPGVFGVHLPDAAVTFLSSACDTAEAVHQVATGVGKCPHPGMADYLSFHMRYNTMSGVISKQMSSSSDWCGR